MLRYRSKSHPKTTCMKTQRLTTYFFGHKVEVTLALSEERDQPYIRFMTNGKQH